MTRKKLYRQFLKNRETKLCNEKKTMAAKQKRRNYDEKKRIRKPTKTISVHTQKMANTNLKNKPSKSNLLYDTRDNNEHSQLGVAIE